MIRYAQCPQCGRRSTVPGRRDKRGNKGRWLKRHLRTRHPKGPAR